MEERNHVIYMITSPSGKSYIGLTKDYEKRMQYHQRPSSGCILIKNAIDKYGWDNLTKEILHENLTLDEANKLEEVEILERNTLSPDGYNLRTGGDSRIVSEETKERQRIAQTGMKHTPERSAKKSAYMTGRKRPDWVVEKVAAANRGKKHSPEHVEKMAASRRGIKQSPEHIEKRASKIRGRKNSPEHIEKVRQAHLGTKATPETIEKLRLSHLGQYQSPESIEKRAAKMRGRVRPPEEVERITFSRNKNNFNKELPRYLENLKLYEEPRIGTVLLSELLGIDRTVISDRIKKGYFPNAYVNGRSWLIPIKDVHDYYAEGIIKYGE
jgi:group I intron endonuclease